MPVYETRYSGLRALVGLLAATAGALGLVVLWGWVLDIPALRSLLPGAVEMKANTAVALVLAAMAVWHIRPHMRQGSRLIPAWSGLALVLLGGLTLAQYLMGWNLYIDEALFIDTGRAYNAAPGRMSPMTAAAFVALGAGLLAWVRPAWRVWSVRLAALVVCVGALALVGYLLGAVELTTDVLMPPVAVHTALALVALGAGLLVTGRAALRNKPAGPVRAESLERTLIAGWSVALVLILIGGGVTYRSYADFARASDRIAHSQEVRAQLARHLIDISQAESALGAFLVAGSQALIDEHISQVKASRARMGQLRQLVQADAVQAQRLEQLDRLAVQRIAQMRQRFDDFQRVGLAGVKQIALGAGGFSTMRELRGITSDMDAAEARLLAQRQGSAQEDRIRALAYLLATLFATACVFFVQMRIVRRETRARAAAEGRLQQLNTELEERIALRGQAIEDRYRQFVELFEFSPDGLVMADSTGQIQRINQRASAMFGWSPADIIGQPVEVLVPQGLRERHVAHRQTYQKQPDLRAAGRPSMQALRRNGEAFPVDISLFPIKTPEGLMIVASVRDITERLQGEAERDRYRNHLEELVSERTRDFEAATHAAQAANVAKSQFLANMSHEIRTPLSAVTGMARLIRREPLSDQQAGHLGKLEAAAGHLAATIHDILELSKIEAGKLALHEGPVQVDSLMDHVMGMLQADAADKQLALLCTVEQMPPHLRGDTTRIGQALLNYAANAIKFTDAGSVTLRARVVDEQADSALVRFEVQDTGVGIAPESQARLFEAFEQADASISRRYGGSGLGLAITQRLVQAMGGQAGFDSALGQGSTFWFTVLLRKGDSTEVPASKAPAGTAQDVLRRDWRGTRVLLAEDDRFNQEVGRILLSDLGLLVDVADDGEAAVRLASAQRYALVLMDLQMPRLDGLTATRQIRQLPGGAAVPIVAMTANVFADDRQRCIEAGMDDFLPKPVQAAMLYDTVLHWLEHGSAHRSPEL